MKKLFFLINVILSLNFIFAELQIYDASDFIDDLAVNEDFDYIYFNITYNK